jgi:hypothetical protein
MGNLIVGKSCPPFEFQLVDGGKITNESAKGKYLAVSIGSFT